ncbi:MAG: GTPase HflX [Fimbriimonadaceae bacterium]|nr:GTPase HflX [Fimbriimonadaceae bacterium]QYK57401.1 MAG: GTPase HflX [Fimbriimonadaceae bacterium]
MAENSTQILPEKLFLVYVNQDSEDDPHVEDELEGLVEAAGGEVAGSMRQRVDRPTKATFVGSGKADELVAYAAEAGADVVVVDAELSGVQLRNLEEKVGRRVIDRTTLILDIFARRAKTREGQLQVELAQLSYMLPRLMSVYTKFERQRGGIGMRGPGETKLESDRRMVNARISKLRGEIDEVKRHREVQRATRREHPYPVVALVGYTSAGKSTLMNRLAGTELLADAMPFATLDPTTRRIESADGFRFFLTDTVGFIRNLPTQLVAAFRSTLEEVSEADLLLHIIDVSHPAWEVQRDAVLETVAELGASEVSMVTVFNKTDALEDRTLARRLVAEWPDSVAVSALVGTGMEDLLAMVLKQLKDRFGLVRALVPYDQNGLVEACHRFGRVLKEEYREDGVYIEAELVDEWRQKLARFVVAASSGTG